MELKRSTMWAAMMAVLLATPAMAVEWQSLKCDAAKCGDEVGCCDPSECCDPAEGCKIKTIGIEVGGWVSSGMYKNQYSANDNGQLTMRSYGNTYTLDQMWAYAEKKADNRGSGLAFGGRVDFMWGADGPDTQCFGDGGWDGDWMTSDDDNYGSAMPQLYGEMAYNDLRVKVGHFYTIMGYEVVQAPENFFYSHSYAFALEPLTHTGALAEYSLNDRVTIHGGWTNGWDNGWINPRNASTFLGGVSAKLRKNVSLSYMTSFGDLEENAGTTWTAYMHSLVLKWNINSRLDYIAQSNFRTDSNEFNGQLYKAYGLDQYLLYKISDRWSAGTRVEWFCLEQAQSGVAGTTLCNATAVTLGLNYTPTERIVVRPEIRWDSCGGNPASSANWFDNNTRSSQFSGGFDCIVKF